MHDNFKIKKALAINFPAQLTRNKLKIRGQPRILSQEEKKLDRKDRLKRDLLVPNRSNFNLRRNAAWNEWKCRAERNWERWDRSWQKNRLDNLTAISFFRHASLHFPPSFAHRRPYCFVESVSPDYLLDRIERGGERKKRKTRSAT